jgi:2-octaprenyl-6-methoxyphenol hydroxylase
MDEARAAGRDADLIVVGGGMVGLTLACAAGRAGLETIVIDALAPERVVAPTFDGRVSALAATSCRLMEAIGVWASLAPQTQPILDIVVSDGRVSRGASPFFLHYDHRELGDGPLGHLVENRFIRRALLDGVAACPAIRHRAPARVVGVERDPDGVTARLEDGTALRAPLCVAADGPDSPVRRSAGIRVTGWSYPQTGIVTTVAHEYPHHGVAQEHFLPSGPFAVLPMPGERASLVWTERTDLARAILALDDAAFGQEVRRRFGDYLGRAEPVGPRWSYPLRLQHARSYIAPRLALVGDAAHVIHPIAGQGLNLGLRDVAALAEVLVDAARLGLDIGAETVLARYQRWRRFDNVLLAGVTDVLNRLFSNDIAPLRLARDLGLGIIGRVGPARRFLMRHAEGAVGDLPRLLRGESL